MPSRSRNKKTMTVDLRTSHFRTNNRDVCERVVNILRGRVSRKSSPWTKHSLEYCSSRRFPFYQVDGGGIYYTSGGLDKDFRDTEIDADLFLVEYDKGRVVFT